MRILQHTQWLRVVAPAYRQLHRVGARRLQDREAPASSTESAFALAQAVGADADVWRMQRAGAEGDALRRRIAQVPLHAVQTGCRRAVQRPDGLSFAVLDSDRR